MTLIALPNFHVETFSDTWKNPRIRVSCRCVIGRDHDYAEWQRVVRGRIIERPGDDREDVPA